MAGAHNVSRLGRLRGRKLGDITDWMPLLTTGINDAASVAQVALKPPTYSSVTTPYGTSITSYGAVAPGVTVDPLTSLLSSPLFLLGGVALLVVLMKR
jgi:hypothetical protein